MYEYGSRDIEKAMRTVLQVLNRKAIPPEETKALREEFKEIWDDIQVFRSDAAYTSFVNEYIADEHRKSNTPREGEESRSDPLCGCPSPSCALKRGELPAAARTRQGSVTQHLSPQEAVMNEIQSHREPIVLREADREWWRVTGEPLSDLMDLQARADTLDREYDTVFS
jgi:hypothetical protein